MGLLDFLKKKREPNAKPPAPIAEELCTVLLPSARPDWAARAVVPAGLPLTIELVPRPLIKEPLDFRFAGGRERGAGQLRVAFTTSELNVAARTGAISALTRLLVEWVGQGAIGVVIHGAGDVVFSPGEWSRRTQLIDLPSWLPTLAWMDVGNAEGIAMTYGLKRFGLPEVAAFSELPQLSADESWMRTQEALLAAACTMVARGAPLDGGELLTVNAGMEFSGAPFAHDNLGLEELASKLDLFGQWHVEVLDGVLRLTPVGQLLPLSARRAIAKHPLPYTAYRWLFIDTLREQGFEKIAFVWPRQLPGVPPHEVMVLERENMYLTTTCGLGRLPQPLGSVEWENEFIEFSLLLPTHGPDIAHALAMLSLAVHGRAEGAPPIARTHRVANLPSMMRFPYPWTVLGSLPDLQLGEGPPVRLYQPMFQTQAERDQVPSDDLAGWISKHGEAALTRWLHHDVVVPLVSG